MGFEAVKDKKGRWVAGRWKEQSLCPAAHRHSSASICYQTACYDCETFIPANSCYKTRDGLNWAQYCQ